MLKGLGGAHSIQVKKWREHWGCRRKSLRSITHRLYLILSHALLIQSQFLRIRSLAACSFITYQLGKWSNASLSKSPLWMRSDCDFWSSRRIWWAWWLGGLWPLLQGNQTQMSLILKSWTVKKINMNTKFWLPPDTHKLYTVYFFILCVITRLSINLSRRQRRCPTPCDPKDCSPPGSSVRGILQARILEWVAIPFSRGSFWPRDRTWSPALQADSLPSQPPGKSQWCNNALSFSLRP